MLFRYQSTQAFDAPEIEGGDFFVKFKLRNKNDDFKWILFLVYGAAQNHLKETFLIEFDEDIDHSFKYKLRIFLETNTSQGNEEDQHGRPTHLHHAEAQSNSSWSILDSRSSPT